MLTAIIAVALTAFVITTWLLAIASDAKPGTDQANARLDAVRTGLAAGAGAGAAVGLMLAFRRQHHQEITTALTDHDATERRITELYTKAVEQLGSDKAPVRLGGLYALERLAQDNRAQRQTIVNVLCAYLRMPFPSEAPVRKTAPTATEDAIELNAETKTTPAEADAWQQERQVRLTAQRILSDHLRRPDADQHLDDSSRRRFWDRIRLDLTGATLIDFSLAQSMVSDARFDNAAFSGDARFDNTAFSGIALFTGTAFSDSAGFGGAAFSGDAGFDNAAFSGNAGFDNAAFSGNARFGGATFSDNARFGGATFSGNARFGGATFSGIALFTGATFGGDAWFGGATFDGIALFDEAVFGDSTRFDNATFSGNAWFSKASFSGRAQFSGATFDGGVGFAGATFSGDAGFAEATFSGAWFDRATFGGDALFGGATFSRMALFNGTAFSDSARFNKATFSGSAQFSEATFNLDPHAVNFTGVLVRSSNDDHVWPAGWQLHSDSNGELTVVHANSSTNS